MRLGFRSLPKTRCLVSEETEIGWHRPLSAEKLNPVLAFYEARDSQHGIEMSINIAKFEGWGHSACLHSNDPDIVAQFAACSNGARVGEHTRDYGGHGLFHGFGTVLYAWHWHMVGQHHIGQRHRVAPNQY